MSNKLWKNISMDFIAQVKSYNTSCIIVDKLCKRAYFIPINIQFLSKDMVQLLNNRVYSLHELLLQIISDREIKHLAEIFWKRCKLLGIKSTISIVYHPQTNRQIEYVNPSISNIMLIMASKLVRPAIKYKVCIQQSSTWGNK